MQEGGGSRLRRVATILPASLSRLSLTSRGLERSRSEASGLRKAVARTRSREQRGEEDGEEWQGGQGECQVGHREGLSCPVLFRLYRGAAGFTWLYMDVLGFTWLYSVHRYPGLHMAVQ